MASTCLFSPLRNVINCRCSYMSALGAKVGQALYPRRPKCLIAFSTEQDIHKKISSCLLTSDKNCSFIVAITRIQKSIFIIELYATPNYFKVIHLKQSNFSIKYAQCKLFIYLINHITHVILCFELT